MRTKSWMVVKGICLAGLLFVSWQDGKTNKSLINKGGKLYAQYACKSCHGTAGIGTGDLRQAYKKFTDAAMKIYIDSPRNAGNEKMPAYAGLIKPADYTPLIAYVKWLGEQSADKKDK